MCVISGEHLQDLQGDRRMENIALICVASLASILFKVVFLLTQSSVLSGGLLLTLTLIILNKKAGEGEHFEETQFKK